MQANWFWTAQKRYHYRAHIFAFNWYWIRHILNHSSLNISISLNGLHTTLRLIFTGSCYIQLCVYKGCLDIIIGHIIRLYRNISFIFYGKHKTLNSQPIIVVYQHWLCVWLPTQKQPKKSYLHLDDVQLFTHCYLASFFIRPQMLLPQKRMKTYALH